MEKLILTIVLILNLVRSGAQISLDSIINLSILNHQKVFEFQLKKYSTDKVFYIKNRTLNDEIVISKNVGFRLDCIESSKFDKWGTKTIGKGKVVVAINKISFEKDKIVFLIIGGIVKKKKKPIQVFSENHIHVHYDIESMSWEYSIYE